MLRHYLPKGTDLSGLTQDDLDAIAWKLNTRPRKLHGFRSPIEVYDEHLAKVRTALTCRHVASSASRSLF